MFRSLPFAIVALLVVSSSSFAQDEEWITMFNGESLLGWHVNENPESVFVEDNCLVVKGDRAHAFFVGETGHADFTNFHFKAKVMTKPGANSGIYFHTAFLESGWPDKDTKPKLTTHNKIKRKRADCITSRIILKLL